MRAPSARYFDAALRLHRYLADRHWTGQALIGPDCGVRSNYRIGRFIKSYLSRIRWNDDYYYLQAQGYWTLSNWRLFACTGEDSYRDIAVRCSAYVLANQQNDGAWKYPNPEWHGRVATGEGSWGSVGLLESYRQTGDRQFLTGALRWHQFLTEAIGFQRAGDELAVNYFAERRGPRVPNNAACVLRLLAELADATGDSGYLTSCSGLIAFLSRVQAPTGEFPYAVRGTAGGRERLHFQCYQYNAFQCLDLLRYYELTADRNALPLIERVARFLLSGVAVDGRVYYDCGNRYRCVTYHTAALAAALAEVDEAGIGNHREVAARAYAYLLCTQRPNGSLPHSYGDYHVLKDQRSYPRNLSMILYHLLTG